MMGKRRLGGRGDTREPSEDVLRGLLAAAPDALVAIDRAGRIVFVSDQAERIFDWPRGELLGRPIDCLVPERFAGGHPALREAYLAHPTTRPMGAGLKLWGRRRDGSEFPAEVSLSSFDTPGGTLVAAAIRDVTEARRAEQRFRAVLESAPDAILAVDVDGRIELVNAQAERLFGWDSDELVGEQVEVLVPAPVRGRHTGHRSTYLADPRARPMGAGLRLSGQRRDGSTFPAEISLSAVTDPLGSQLVLAAVRDITDRVELEDARRRQALEVQRERSQRLESLGQLAGGIAHDFNNLLGVILSYTTLVSRRVSDPTVTDDLAEIHAAAERAAGLTRQLLAFARRDPANPEPLELNEVVKEVASMLERTLGEHIDLRLVLTDEPMVAVADRHHIEQIVMNLAINARDAMPEGGALTITTERFPADGGEVVLEVTDTGSGMPPDVLARAFEPFFTTKPTGEGTGLGLATVYGIVGQSGGEVTIRSVVDGGTTVTVVLPSVRQVVARRETTDDSRGGSERILLVEDELALSIGTARILRDRGYDVVVASDGVEGMEIFRREAGSIDLVVSDVAMPNMRGDEMARRMADLDADVKVVFMSGYDSKDSVLSGPVLAKPVPEVDLLRAIRAALED
jgi:PAS domain S-box-containing protein